ncbi:hypothetical protein DNTS_019007 [Danionella cerebrum]|uniref:Ig-like domain-containing protein n=1 Tax=Danionella cerebrum TaxID=2873325 RepID=A0A553RJK4_9TELE|nr:hypothetical protein DNTS_019007 [Danionella translucida]
METDQENIDVPNWFKSLPSEGLSVLSGGAVYGMDRVQDTDSEGCLQPQFTQHSNEGKGLSSVRERESLCGVCCDLSSSSLRLSPSSTSSPHVCEEEKERKQDPYGVYLMIGRGIDPCSQCCVFLMMGCFWILLKLLLLFISFGICSGVCPRRCACSTPAEVHCTFRALTHIPSTISKYVQRMNFGFNSITQISEASFKGLGKLELLMMHGNNMEKIPDGALQDLVSLQVLKLTYNKLSIITGRSFSGLSSLVRLHLDHNRISFIEPDAFMGLISLRLLHLESNRLTQIHPHTFSTLRILEFFTVSTLKILDLSDNQILGLSGDTMESLSQVEKIFIQGNPLSCDCRMGWMQSWRDMKPGVLQCKKDRSFARDQICPICASPKHLKGQNLLELKEFTCSAPSISSSEKTASLEGIWELLPIDRIKPPFGNISFTFSDDHATKVDLVCQVLKTESAKINWNSTKPLQIVTNITLSLDVECPVSRGDYESFWRLLAYYSDVPLHLRKEIMLSREPSVSYRYKQNIEKDAYFYTGVRANVLAHPSWLMQANMNIKLNRPYSSSKSVRLLLDTHLFSSIDKGSDRPWVMIEHNNKTQTNFLSIIGAVVEMDCRIQSSGTPQIHWMLPDGTKIKPTSEKRRLAVTENGKLHIKPVEHRDDGVYYCIAEVLGDVDILAFRLSVIESSTPVPGNEIGNALTKFVGESASLPCLNTASPDAEIYWIFPNGSLANIYANSPRAVVFPNGTLSIPVSQLNNNGYYKCVVINQLGVDVLATKVTVMRRKGIKLVRKFPSKPQFASGVSTKVKAILKDVDEASGDASEEQEQSPSVSEILNLGNKDSTSSEEEDGSIASAEEIKDHIQIYPTTRLSSVTPSTTLPNANEEIHPTEISFSLRTDFPDYLHHSESPFKDPIREHESSNKPSNLPVLQTRPRISSAKVHTVTVNAGADVFLTCDSVGEPKTLLTWTKVSTGAVMSTNTKIHRFEVHPNGSLIIQNVQLQDRGQYLCTVQNPYGIDKMMLTLVVSANMPQMLLPRHQDVSVLLGNTALLPCHAQGLPTPNISWTLPDHSVFTLVGEMNQKVMLFPNGSLQIKNANYLDKGIYKCVASNAAGADMLSVQLQITALPPAIKEVRRENMTLLYGNSALIHCTVTGAPTPSIRWVTFYGTQLRPSQFINSNLFVLPNGTLFIRNPIERDSGIYECVAVNAVGLAKRSVNLQVKKGSNTARIVSTSPIKTEVGYGADLKLNCTATGSPSPRIIWRTPANKLIDAYYSSNWRMNVLHNGTLSISSVTEKDQGDYLCVARNKMGDDFVLLKVKVLMKAAKIDPKALHNHKVSYGGELKVDCIASGLPNPEITWSLPDGTTVNTTVRNKRYLMFNNGTLFVNEVGMNEEGDYTCSAENQIGKDQMRVHIKVVANSPIIRGDAYSVVKFNYGETGILNCSAKGEPTPNITWLCPDNSVLHPVSNKYQISNDGMLLISKLKKTDSGNYTCFARNVVGMVKKVVYVDVFVALPFINGVQNPGILQRSVKKDQRVQLECNASGSPFPRIIWVFPNNVVLPAPYFGSRITVHRNGTLDIHAVRLSDSVELSCIARNEGGDTKLTVNLKVMEDVEKPRLQNPIYETITMNYSEITLNCSIEGKPTPEISWILPNGTTLFKGASVLGFHHRSDGALVIKEPTISDVGRYRCFGQNDAGNVERMVTLESSRKPEIVNKYTSLVSIINGENLHLHCLSSGLPVPQLTWTLPNGVILNRSQTSGLYSVHSNGTLTVQRTSVYDRGVYKCQTNNKHGSSTLSVSVIIIAYPPRITQGPSRVTYAHPGKVLKIDCISLATPRAELVWETPDALQLKVDSQPRLYGNKFVHPDGSLRIQNLSTRDSGVYTCIASNVLGSDKRSTYVYVF